MMRPLDAPVFSRPQGSTYDERCAALLDFYATRDLAEIPETQGAIEVGARLVASAPLESVLPRLERLLADPSGDMFWMYPMAWLHHVGQGRLPADMLRRMRDLWRTYTPYRGDTENHWLIYYASLALISELYPDDPGEAWFDGRSSREHLDDASAYIAHWVDLTTRRGQGEFDSPHYLPFFVAPLAMLHGHIRDESLRTRAAMMLDYVLADFAVDTLDGVYAGAHSRVYPAPLLERRRNGSTTLSWLLFGNVPFVPDLLNVVLPRIGYRPHGVALLLALSGYRPPAVLRRIATEREAPAVHRERKRTRHRIRYADERNAPVYKTMYMDPAYAVGSIQGGLLQPIQQHTWDVQWATADPHEGFNLLFSVHPYADAHELGMYFAEQPKLLVHAVVQHEKNTYDKPDKWTGGSPHEHVLQHLDTVVALYDIPPDAPSPFVGVYVSRTLREVTEDASGWIVARGGDAWLGVRTLTPAEWRDEPDGDRRLHLPSPRTGLVLHVAPAARFASAAAFLDALRALPLDADLSGPPRVRLATLRGDRLDAAYGQPLVVNGEATDLDAWPLFDGPHLEAAVDSRRLVMRHGALRRTLDFDTLTVTDHTESP